jgi:hypothetical protein
VQVIEPAVLVILCPLVQLALDPEYPLLGRLGSTSSTSLFNDDLLAFQAHSANLLPPFAMWTALPPSDYYGGSAPPGAISRRRACPPARGRGGQHRTVPTFTVDRSAGSATSFSPDSLATSTPQAFLVAS